MLTEDRPYRHMGYGSWLFTGSPSSVATPPPTDAPTATSETVAVAHDTATAIALSGASAQQCDLAFMIVSSPAHGTLSSTTAMACSGAAPNFQDTAKIIYTPAAGYAGADAFTFKVSDGTYESAVATVTLDVLMAA